MKILRAGPRPELERQGHTVQRLFRLRQRGRQTDRVEAKVRRRPAPSALARFLRYVVGTNAGHSESSVLKQMNVFWGESWRAVAVGLMVSIVLFTLGVAPLAQAQPGAPPPGGESPPAAPNLSEDYRLGAGDEVRVTVYGEKDLTGEFYVSASGKISLPLIGEVDASGRTIREVEKSITTKLADGYLVDPKVACEVLIFRPFYIYGEVNKPGQYPYTNGLTAIKAVATAEGFTYRANTKHIFIRHSGETAEHEYALKDVIYVQPGDTLRVGERFF